MPAPVKPAIEQSVIESAPPLPSPSMRERSLLLVLLAEFWLAAGCGSPAPSWHGSPSIPAVPAADFLLEDQFGRPFELRSQAGKVTLLFFGYTQCPDVCPATVANVGWLFGELGDPSERLTFAFVTVDPERDSPAVLGEYLGRFNPGFLGLTGEPAALEQIRADYGVAAEVDHSQHGDDYLMIHTGRLFLIDQQSLLQTSYGYGTPREDILLDLRAMLEGG